MLIAGAASAGQVNKKTYSNLERGRLRACAGIRYVLLNPILEELATESKIKMTAGKHGEFISRED